MKTGADIFSVKTYSPCSFSWTETAPEKINLKARKKRGGFLTWLQQTGREHLAEQRLGLTLKNGGAANEARLVDYGRELLHRRSVDPRRQCHIVADVARAFARQTRRQARAIVEIVHV